MLSTFGKGDLNPFRRPVLIAEGLLRRPHSTPTLTRFQRRDGRLNIRVLRHRRRESAA